MYKPKFPLPFFGRNPEADREFLKEGPERPVQWTNPLEGLSPEMYEALLARKNILGTSVDKMAYAFAAKDAAEAAIAPIGQDPNMVELAQVTDELQARRNELMANIALNAASRDERMAA